MSSNYNSRDTIEEVLVKGKNFGVIRRRINNKELMKYEEFASWLK